jgi:hypothetical protein
LTAPFVLDVPLLFVSSVFFEVDSFPPSDFLSDFAPKKFLISC